MHYGNEIFVVVVFFFSALIFFFFFFPAGVVLLCILFYFIFCPQIGGKVQRKQRRAGEEKERMRVLIQG